MFYALNYRKNLYVIILIVINIKVYIVNQEDILKQSKNIILKLKSKVLGDLSILVDSLSLMIEMIISLCNKHNQAERDLRNVKTKSKVSGCIN